MNALDQIDPKIPSVTEFAQSEIVAVTEPLFVGSDLENQQIDGLELSDAAAVLGVSIDELWRRIKNGALVARSVLGKVFVYTDLHHEDLPLPPPPMTRGHHPSLNAPRSELALARHSGSVSAPLSTPEHLETFNVPMHPDLALVIDHLSLAKEENREILRLTQDSMTRLTQMTDSILEMKDSIIASKEEQIAIMKERLADQAKELSQALKEKENLETLARAIQI